MLKKFILVVLLSGLIGFLVWGGINRTLAKTNESGGRYTRDQNVSLAQYSEGNGEQQHGKIDRFTNSYGDDYHETNISQTQIVSQSESSDIANQTDISGQNYNNYGGRGNGNGKGSGQGGGSDPLAAAEIDALNLALDDEYHALAVYQTVIETFGAVEPFAEIAMSEHRHVDALLNQFIKHDLPIPENHWIGNVPTFESFHQACQAGVKAEIANADLYNHIFSMTDDPNLTRIFSNLSNASLRSHLLQFENCQ